MGARKFSDLAAWQLANDLKRGVYGLVDSSGAASDFGFRDQIRTAAASAPANIAEGFARFHHADFARFLRIALGSLDELDNHLHDGIDRKHWNQPAIEPLLTLKRRSAAAITGLIRYLRTSGPPT